MLREKFKMRNAALMYDKKKMENSLVQIELKFKIDMKKYSR